MLAFCLGEVSAKLLEDYDIILKKLEQNTGAAVTVQMDGGGFNN
jgi:hypothetical protein